MNKPIYFFNNQIVMSLNIIEELEYYLVFYLHNNVVNGYHDTLELTTSWLENNAIRLTIDNYQTVLTGIYNSRFKDSNTELLQTAAFILLNLSDNIYITESTAYLQFDETWLISINKAYSTSLMTITVLLEKYKYIKLPDSKYQYMNQPDKDKIHMMLFHPDYMPLAAALLF